MFRRSLLIGTAAMLCNAAEVIPGPGSHESSEPVAKPKRTRASAKEAASTTTSGKNKDGWYEYSATVIGTSPMLQNPATEDVLDTLQFGAKSKKSIDKSTPSPMIAFKKLNKGPNGEFGIPTEWLRACFVTAGRQVILDKKEKMSTAGDSKIPAFLKIRSDLENENGDMFIAFADQTGSDVTLDDLANHRTLEEFEKATGKMVPWLVDRRKGNLKQGAGKGVAVPIIRPKFKQWSFTVNLHVNHEIVEISKIEELIKKAGMYSGLGDFRPGCKGEFGCFKLKELVEIGKIEEDLQVAA